MSRFAATFSLVILTLIGSMAGAKERVVFWYGATQREQDAYKALISDFSRTHPDIEVQGMLVPQTYVERKLILSVAGGVPADVVRFYAHLGGEMMSRGGLEPLDDLVTRDRLDMKDFYPVGLQQNTFRGKLYGIPWILSPNALFYNRKLFAEAGLDPNRPPKNWKEVEDYALKLTKRNPDGSIDRIGFANFMNNPADFHLYLWQRGGEPLSPDLKHIAFDGPQGLDALKWMRGLLVREAGPTEAGIPEDQAAAAAFKNVQVFSSSFVGATQDVFGMEKLAMRVDSPFRIPDFQKYFPNLDYAVAPVPYDKTDAVEVVGNALVIPRGSRHREAAWKFIKFASSPEQMLRICSAAGRIPARKSAATTPSFYNNRLVKPFVDQIAYGRTTPVAPGYREASAELAVRIEDALKGKRTPEDALKAAAVKGQSILDDANEDISKLTPVPWGTMAVIGGLLLAAMLGGGAWYVLGNTRDSRTARREALTFYLFLSPWLVGFIVFTFGSTLASLIFSFSKWDIINPARFVGLRNFAELFANDPRFFKALGNTLYYAAFSIPLAIIGGLAISVLMNQKLRGITAFRAVYYLPAVVSGVATAMLWQFIFNPKTGLLNKALMTLGVGHLPTWLMDPVWVKPAFIIMSIWGVGGAMMIYLAGLNGISEELYEAAKIDGANSWQRFLKVTLPLLSPTIFYQLIIGTVAAFQFFTPAYIMTGGGPDDASLFYSLYLFKNAFEWMKMGYASALAWILFAIVLFVTMVNFKVSGKWVYYEGKDE